MAMNEGIILSERPLPAFIEQSHIVMYVGVGIVFCQRAQQMVRSFHFQDGVIYLVPMFPAVRLTKSLILAVIDEVAELIDA